MLATGWLCAVTLPALNANADPTGELQAPRSGARSEAKPNEERPASAGREATAAARAQDPQVPVSLEASDALGRVIFALREAQMDNIASAPRETSSVKLEAGDAARVDPRGWLRRWHQRGLLQPVSAALADSNP